MRETSWNRKTTQIDKPIFYIGKKRSYQGKNIKKSSQYYVDKIIKLVKKQNKNLQEYYNLIYTPEIVYDRLSLKMLIEGNKIIYKLINRAI